MHDWETRMRLKHYLELGMTKAELSRRFGVSRRTVHYWIESGQSASARGPRVPGCSAAMVAAPSPTRRQCQALKRPHVSRRFAATTSQWTRARQIPIAKSLAR